MSCLPRARPPRDRRAAAAAPRRRWLRKVPAISAACQCSWRRATRCAAAAAAARPSCGSTAANRRRACGRAQSKPLAVSTACAPERVGPPKLGVLCLLPLSQGERLGARCQGLGVCVERAVGGERLMMGQKSPAALSCCQHRAAVGEAYKRSHKHEMAVHNIAFLRTSAVVGCPIARSMAALLESQSLCPYGWRYGVVVSTADSESADPSSNLGTA